MNDDWIIGFFEGEGCFMYGKDAFGDYFPRIVISQNERRILEKIQNRLQMGHINKNGPNCNQWHIEHYRNCRKFYHFVKGRLLTEYKQNQLENWLKKFPKILEENK